MQSVLGDLTQAWDQLPADGMEGHDETFWHATALWQIFMACAMPGEAEKWWTAVIRHALAWESMHAGRRLHKGTPYYFAGVTAILNGNLDRGFLLMHQAVEEDRVTCETIARATQDASKEGDYLKLPAYLFVTLNSEAQDQFFKGKVDEVAEYLRSRIEEYNKATGRAFTLADFRARFLAQPQMVDEAFAFVFALYRLKAFEDDRPAGLETVFRSIYLSDLYFQICRVLECLLQEELGRTNMLGGLLPLLASEARVGWKQLTHDEIEVLKKKCQADFDGMLRLLLSHKYAYSSGAGPSPAEESMLVASTLRNFGAHRIEQMLVLGEEFLSIRRHLINAILTTVDLLS
ncbi:MAG: hypothetical protein AB1714_18920 [Acidobacteriota bacterium]